MPPVRQTQSALVEQHRQAQLANRAGFLAEFLAAWGLLDVANLDAATPHWLRIVLRLVRAFRQSSADLALNHYRDLRRIGLPDTDVGMPEIEFDLTELRTAARRRTPGASVPIRVERDPRGPDRPARLTLHWDRADRAVESALRITGPINIKSRIGRGENPEKAKRSALVDASGSAARQVMNGGRSTTLSVVQNDQRAIGWIRVTDGDPCSFCAMLASRGITWGPYAKESFKKSNEKFSGTKFESEHTDDPRIIKRGEVQVHDHCGCSLAVIFDRRDPLLQRNREYRQLWDDHIAGRYGGKDALNAWRRLHERPEVFRRKAGFTPRRKAA